MELGQLDRDMNSGTYQNAKCGNLAGSLIFGCKYL